MEEKNLTFEHDELVDYALDCKQILYEYLKAHLLDYRDWFDRGLLERKLSSQTLSLMEIRKILECIERNSIGSTGI